MSANNSKPKTNAAPVIVIREDPSSVGRYLLLMVPALLGSLIFHAVLVAAFVLYVIFNQETRTGPETDEIKKDTITTEQVEEKKETFTVTDIDESAQEFDTNIQYMAERIADVSVPGSVNPNEAVGIKDGDKSAPPVNLPAPGGFTTKGQGGPFETTGPGNSMAVGEVGGYSPRGMPLQGTFYGRSGATREYALREGGGTKASEACVTRGLQWLIRQQQPSGAWSMSGNEANEIAATALGLLPFLAAGKTHKPADKNPYDKNILRALNFLKRKQDRKTGYFTGGMYAHGLATIAMCEAYGLSQDPLLRPHAQAAIYLIASAQHDTDGGWRYGPTKTAQGDMSISGWQIMALKSGMMAGLNVPAKTVANAKKFLALSMNTDSGYGYVPRGGSTYRMTAVGLLCRQYLENWGPSNPKMIDAVQKHIVTHSPDIQDSYYYYYATQVLHHFGGETWRKWNDKMRENLIRKQESNEKSPNFGSWAPQGDPWGRVGGRLMMTSLNLLTLEVYYRYLPLYYRDAGYGKDAAVQKAF
ncbi:MAG: terpene cyclase/mutase family protein [Planctomycetes bacterium]|nr:terpene cyclase/mutase family protein [Planctomycetota bacterium]